MNKEIFNRCNKMLLFLWNMGNFLYGMSDDEEDKVVIKKQLETLTLEETDNKLEKEKTEDENLKDIEDSFEKIFENMKLMIKESKLVEKPPEGILIISGPLSVKVIFNIKSNDKIIKELHYDGYVWKRLVNDPNKKANNLNKKEGNNIPDEEEEGYSMEAIYRTLKVLSGTCINYFSHDTIANINVQYGALEVELSPVTAKVMKMVYKKEKEKSKLSFLSKFGYIKTDLLNIKDIIEQGSKEIDKNANKVYNIPLICQDKAKYQLEMEIQHYLEDENGKKIPISFYELKQKYQEENNDQPFKLSTIFNNINDNNAVTKYKKNATNTVQFTDENEQYVVSDKVKEERKERREERKERRAEKNKLHKEKYEKHEEKIEKHEEKIGKHE